MNNFYGFYRARVIENDIKNYRNYGGILVFVPDLQIDNINPNHDPSDGLIAYPANNPVGGRSYENEDAKFQGSVYVPAKGSYVWIFFEKGDPNRPFYFAAFDSRISELPPENTLATEPAKVYTIIKTNQGRSIVVSDSSGDERVEITGKKRNLSGTDPAGNGSSTYEIEDNQTTIFFDERDENEKILIMTHKGDYINIDIENRSLNINFDGKIKVKSTKDISFESSEDVHIKGRDLYFESTRDIHEYASGSLCQTSNSTMHINSPNSLVRIDGKPKAIANRGIRRMASRSSPESPETGDIDRD